MKSIAKLLFGFWYALACMILVTDAVSYSQLMGSDWFQMMNREYDVMFGIWFIYLPFILLGCYIIINLTPPKK